MEPDVDPPMLPLQGPRVRPSTSTRNVGNTSSSTFNTTIRQPSRRAQQPSPKKGQIARLPASARSATRVASQVRRPTPPTAAKRSPERSAPTPAPTRPAVRSARDNPTTRSKTVLPVGERTSQGQGHGFTRARTTSEAERGDITPDGGSAGREGRQFTVSNVGNNGRIYLRYVCKCSEILEAWAAAVARFSLSNISGDMVV